MYDDVCYNKSFLKQVIARVDFVAPIDAFEKPLPAKIANEVGKRFPISEPNISVGREFQISEDAVQDKRVEIHEWTFHGKEREKFVTVTKNAAFVSISRYTTYEAMESDFFLTLDSIFAAYPDTRGSRLGLRYINNIEIPEKVENPLVWNDLISEDLVGLTKAFPAAETVSRLFNIVELRKGDIGVKFQFGLPNPDYPAAIKRPLFVLDVDASTLGSLDLGELKAQTKNAHAQIQEVFESSITDALRERMGEQE